VWKRALPKEILHLGVREIIQNIYKSVYILSHLQKKHRNIVRYADVSFNTEIYTIQELSKEAQSKIKSQNHYYDRNG
jgi:predicted amino acid racemase